MNKENSEDGQLGNKVFVTIMIVTAIYFIIHFGWAIYNNSGGIFR